MEEVNYMRFQCLIGLGAQQSNPNARNYYLSQALELKVEDMGMSIAGSQSMIESILLAAIFNCVAVNIIPEKGIGYKKNFFILTT